MPVNPFPSPPTPITRGQAVFAQAEFVAIYPEFTGIPSAQNQESFTEATLLLNNGPCSRVQDANIRLSLLYMLTAHLSYLEYGTNDGAGNVNTPPGVVGRIANASEGSVSVSTSYADSTTESLAFFSQTKYGTRFWQATMQYRTMHYIPAPQSGPNGPGFPFNDWGWGGLE